MSDSPSAFETAILQQIARERPSLPLDLARLRVRRRKFTGIGCYTDFYCASSGRRTMVTLDAGIDVPGIPHGLSAILFFRGQQPECLETVTHGEVPWAGTTEGFSISEPRPPPGPPVARGPT